ncbi:uncharacterized protein BJ212DRAFT_126564 [Suillus subaureus]|uniref:Uncharacterized protein n=1 Tax=Suillus subaureus TaxID=48587 RepID=A0A9P7ECV7_9AGAM|nr:uncharacterized protein BJ212DRAFT_126564 [Suillus subaureus]KAG1818149.1 hypothetical protein BJ212DRAFT_126564 [Suillus subaureus]
MSNPGSPHDAPAAPGQRGPLFSPMGSAHGTAPPTPSIINSSIMQSPAPNGTPSVPPASNPASQPQPNPSDLPPNYMSPDFIQSMSASEDLDPSMFRTDFERAFREWFDDPPGQRGPSSNPTGSALGTVPPTPNTTNASIRQSPALNGIHSVPLASNEPMFRADFERDFREWFDPTGVDFR